MTALPSDYARCSGWKRPKPLPILFEECQYCLRRTSLKAFPSQIYYSLMEPPEFNPDGTCPERIPPAATL